MAYASFGITPDEESVDLRLYQFGWEQCAPLHSVGPHAENHFLFHYIISGRGTLDISAEGSPERRFCLHENQGFLICPGQAAAYSADRKRPWKYVWLEFDGLQAVNCAEQAGLGICQPVYSPQNTLRENRCVMRCSISQNIHQLLHCILQVICVCLWMR